MIFYHNPLSFFCGGCGKVVEIMKPSIIPTPDGKVPRFKARCHTGGCPNYGKAYILDHAPFQINAVET